MYHTCQQNQRFWSTWTPMSSAEVVDLLYLSANSKVFKVNMGSHVKCESGQFAAPVSKFGGFPGQLRPPCQVPKWLICCTCQQIRRFSRSTSSPMSIPKVDNLLHLSANSNGFRYELVRRCPQIHSFVTIQLGDVHKSNYLQWFWPL